MYCRDYISQDLERMHNNRVCISSHVGHLPVKAWGESLIQIEDVNGDCFVNGARATSPGLPAISPTTTARPIHPHPRQPKFWLNKPKTPSAAKWHTALLKSGVQIMVTKMLQLVLLY